MSVVVGEPGTKYVRLEIDFWYDVKQHDIHIASRDGSTLITTVNDRAGSERCHKNLYMKLRRLLEENGRWPEGA